VSDQQSVWTLTDIQLRNIAAWVIIRHRSLKAQFACKPEMSHLAQGESGEGGHAGLPVQVHPGAGVTTPADSPYQAPAGITSLSLLARTTTGNAG